MSQELAALKVSECTREKSRQTRRDNTHTNDSVLVPFIHLSLRLKLCSCKLGLCISCQKLYKEMKILPSTKIAGMARCPHGDRRICRRFLAVLLSLCVVLRTACSNKQMKAEVGSVSGDLSSCFCADVSGKHKIKQRLRKRRPSVHTSPLCFVLVTTCEKCGIVKVTHKTK